MGRLMSPRIIFSQAVIEKELRCRTKQPRYHMYKRTAETPAQLGETRTTIFTLSGHKRTSIQHKENKAPVIVKHFIVCNYILGNPAELGIGMLLVMEKLIYDSKDTYQEATHWVGQQSGFNKTSPCVSNLSSMKPSDLTI